MTPLFWLLIFLAAIVLWFLLKWVFVPLGYVLMSMWYSILDTFNLEKEREDKDDER